MPTSEESERTRQQLLEENAALRAELAAVKVRPATADAGGAEDDPFADFFDNAVVGLHFVGRDGIVQRANRAELELLGYAADEYVGRHISEFHADPPVIADILARLGRGEALHNYEARLRCKDGSIRDVLISSNVCWKDGAFNHTRCFTRDVTERKRADELQARLAAIVESSDDAVVSKTLDGTIRTWNQGARQLFGYTAEEAVGRPITLLLPPDRLGEEADVLARLRRGERVENLETIRVAKDGRLLEVSVTISPVRDARGRVIGASKIARDISGRKRAQEEMRAAKEAAEAANAAKDRFLAVLSHELRTPLTPVLAAVTFVEDRPDLPPDLRGEIGSIRRNVEAEARLIDDLLDLTRIGRGKMELHFEVVDAHAALRDALEVYQPDVGAKRIEVTTGLWAARHLVWADPGRLRQVLRNLVGNAVKFTPAGGRIHLRTSDDPQGGWTVQVSDSGIGIEPEAMGRIFNPFEQGERTVTRKFGGLGLGLAISKALVEMHKGSLSAASDGAGKGATFTLRLDPVPAVPAPVGTEDPPSAPAPPGRIDKRILLVEDHEDTCRILARLLRGMGYAVQTAGSVKDALDLAEHGHFDLLVSDIGLPDGSGLEIMRQVKARHHLRGVALSGFGMEEDLRNSREAGFEQHLVKPVSFQQLETVIRRAAS